MAMLQRCRLASSKGSANACRLRRGRILRVSSDHYRSLAGQLEYFDLRELQDTITNRALWPEFESRFGTKEALAARFGQLAELRNAIRHSRTVDEITRTDGEAALLWFRQVLAN